MLTTSVRRQVTTVGVAIVMALTLAGAAQAAAGSAHPLMNDTASRVAAPKPAVAVVAGLRIASGRTTTQDWRVYSGPDGPGIWVQVDTTAAGFSGAPTYVTSLGGLSLHWVTTGASAVYPPDATLAGDLRRGFRVFLRFPDGRAIDPGTAVANGWYINWIGSE